MNSRAPSHLRPLSFLNSYTGQTDRLTLVCTTSDRVPYFFLSSCLPSRIYIYIRFGFHQQSECLIYWTPFFFTYGFSFGFLISDDYVTRMGNQTCGARYEIKSLISSHIRLFMHLAENTHTDSFIFLTLFLFVWKKNRRISSCRNRMWPHSPLPQSTIDGWIESVGRVEYFLDWLRKKKGLSNSICLIDARQSLLSVQMRPSSLATWVNGGPKNINGFHQQLPRLLNDFPSTIWMNRYSQLDTHTTTGLSLSLVNWIIDSSFTTEFSQSCLQCRPVANTRRKRPTDLIDFATILLLFCHFS